MMSFLRHRFLSIFSLAAFSGFGLAHAMQKIRPPTIPDLNFENVTVEQAIDQIRILSKKDDPTSAGLNIILLKQDLAPIQTSSRFSLQGKDILYNDLLYAICKRLGLGYRIDTNAIVIGSGNRIALPPPNTQEAVTLAGKIRLDLTWPD